MSEINRTQSNIPVVDVIVPSIPNVHVETPTVSTELKYTSQLINNGEDGTSPYATEHYVDEHAGTIEHIEVNGAEQPVVDRTVDISVPTNTSQLVNDSGYVTTSGLSGLASKEWVTGQGYLTQHQDISDKASIEQLRQVENEIPSISGLATETYVIYADDIVKNWADARFLTAHQSLDNYYTKSEVDASVNGKVDKVAGKGLSTNDYTSEEKVKLANALTEHQSLEAYSTVLETGNIIELEMNSSTYSITAKLYDKYHTLISASAPISIPQESVITDGYYDFDTREIVLILKNGTEIRFYIGDLVSGLQPEITEQNKLPYTLISGTPDLSDMATESWVRLQSYITTTDIQNYYSKNETDTLLGSKQDTINADNKLNYDYLSNTPAIPTDTAQLTNSAGYVTEAYHDSTKQDVIQPNTYDEYGAATTVQNNLDSHELDTNLHVSAQEKQTWNAKSDFSGDYDDLINKPSIPSKTSDLVNDSTYQTLSDVTTAIEGEATLRDAADVDLQAQIDALESKTDVIDVVATKDALDHYDTSKVHDNDVIKVLQDESRNNATTYYRWITNVGSWTFVGALGPFYTKSQVDDIVTGINSSIGVVQNSVTTHTNNNDIHVTASDKTAWTAKQDALTFDTVPTANSTNPVTSGGIKSYVDTYGGRIDSISVNNVTQPVVDKNVDITVPTALSDLTDDSTHRTVTDVEKAAWSSSHDSTYIGPTPPTDSGYTMWLDTSQQSGSTGYVVNTINGQHGDVTITIPTVPTNTSDLVNDGDDGTSAFATEDYVDTHGGKIDTIKVNNIAQPIVDKTVNITVPSVTSGLYTTTITGDGTTTTFTITHNLDQINNYVLVYDDAGKDVVVDVTRTSANVNTIEFATAPAQDVTYTVAVLKSGGVKGDNGNGILAIQLTSGDHSPGTLDTYTITYTDTTTSTFQVYNGADGQDSGVLSVNTQTGNVVLDADDISDTDTTNKFVTSAEKSTWNGKQDTLTAGNNISISSNTISATGVVRYDAATSLTDAQMERARYNIGAINGNIVANEGWNQLADLGNATTSTQSGVAFTVNSANGTVTANGTPSGTSIWYFNVGLPIVGHKYLLTGCPSGGSDSTYYLQSYRTSDNSQDFGSGIIFTGDSATSHKLRIVVKIAVSNLVFKPQLIDLTAIYGAGNEPTTVAEFRSQFPNDYYPYDSGVRSRNPSNPNLLDNWWFGSGVINQRGQNSYSGNAYGIDRWKCENSSSSMTVGDGYITVVNWFAQPMETSLLNELSGKTITLSMMDTNGQIRAKTFYNFNPNADAASTDGGLTLGFYTYDKAFRCNTVGASFSLKAAKLELGSVSTLANDAPPNTATELQKCQRYYQRITKGIGYNIFAFGFTNNVRSGQYDIPLLAPIRKLTSIGTGANQYKVGFSNIYLCAGTTFGTSAKKVDSIDCFAVSNEGYQITATLPNTATTHELGLNSFLQFRDSTGYIEISADL